MTDINTVLNEELTEENINVLCAKLNLSKEALISLIEQNSDLSLKDFEYMAQMAQRQQSLNERLVKNFEDNMQMLSEFYPKLYSQFKDYKPERSFEFFISDDEYANLQFLDNKDILYKNSNVSTVLKDQYEQVKPSLTTNCLHYDKQVDMFGQIHIRYFNEAIGIMDENSITTNLFKAQDSGFIPHLILFGCGLGYILDYLYRDFTISNLLVLEPNADLFYASLYTYDWKSLITAQRENFRSIVFIVGKTDIYDEWYDYYRVYGTFMAACRATYVHYLDDKIQTLVDLYNDKFYTYSAALGIFDDSMFGMSHATHNLLAQYPLAREGSLVSEKYRFAPVFVIGNGPSLDNDIAFLRANQDKGIVIACGSALDTLYNAGIQADIYVATERMAYISQTLDIFEGTSYLDDVLCIGSCVLHPDVLKHFRDVIIFDKAGECFREGLILNGDRAFTQWGSLSFINPLVGNAGLTTAITLGFKNIYLFGMDNGKVIGSDNVHSSFSELYSKKYALNEKSPLAGSEMVLKGNFGKDVLSNQLYKAACDSFERMLRSRRDDNELICINCSDGAYLNYTRPVRSADIDASSFESIDKRALKNHLLNDLTFNHRIDPKVIEGIFNKEQYDKLSSSIIQIFNRPCKSKDELILLLRSVSSMLNDLKDTNLTVISQTLDAAAQYFFILMTTVLCARKDDSQALEIVERIIERYIYFLEDSQFIFKYMPDYLESSHVSFLGGSLGFDHDGSTAPKNLKAFSLLDKKQLEMKKASFKKLYV